MFCWGSTVNGELGIGGPDVEEVTVPKLNDFPSSWKVKQVASGLNHTLCLTEDGQVYSCGSNEVGQLGHKKSSHRLEHMDSLQGFNIVQVACGDQHSLALTAWGMVFAWGENSFGQLGLNSMDPLIDVPKLLKSLALKCVVQLACGSNHSLVLTSDCEVYSWGLNNSGQLGQNHNDGPVRDPSKINLLTGVPLRLITAGGQNSAALTSTGFLLTWGSNKHGQLGIPLESGTYSNVPGVVPNLASYSHPIEYVSLGENHTAALDAKGKLWTFGSGRYGQLGHGNNENSSVPKPVLDLIGSKVSKVACGRGHTIAYIQCQGQLRAFGQGMVGQLGINTLQNINNPQLVIGPWKNLPDENAVLEKVESEDIFFIKNIFAGGDASFAIVTKDYKQSSADLISSFLQPLKLEVDKINAMLSVEDDGMIDDDLFTYAEVVFGSLSCWNLSFLKKFSSKLEHGLNYRLAEEYMGKLGRITRGSLQCLISMGIKNALKQVPVNPPTSEVLRSLFVLPLWKGFNDPKNALSYQNPYATAVLSLPSNSIQIYRNWLRTIPLDFWRNVLVSYKKVVSYIIMSQNEVGDCKHLSASNKEEKVLLRDCLMLLKLIYTENKKNRVELNYEEFYIPEIAENIDLKMDYLLWQQLLGNMPVLYQPSLSQICFCEYPFLFDSQAKTLVLRADATKQMQGAIQNAMMNSNIFECLTNPTGIQFLTLRVNRDNLVVNTIDQLLHSHTDDLKKPLKVQFIGEEAEDAGGVRKEFFLLLLRDLLNPDFGMFKEHDSKIIWFRPGTLEVARAYSLIGIVCGLAIYNFTIINLPFPLALYKKLLGEPVTIDDYREVEPLVVRNWYKLLEYEGEDFEDVFGLNFTVSFDNFGETKVIPLKTGGEDISVTNANKQEYITLLSDWYLNKSIASQFESFYDGFMKVCGGAGGVLKLFQPMELQALVTGNENYDWIELQKNTVYKGVYYGNHPVIQNFWEVFHELSLDQKKDFLMFLTGSSRIPILGMKAVRMSIEPTSDDNYLPVAHTCVGQLDLPQYRTKEKLKYKLLQAIQQSQGFGLV